MTFQAYMDNIKAKTGKSPDDFKSLAAEKGLVEYKPLLAWLKTDYGLGQGHANAMAHVILGTFESKPPADEQIDKKFGGNKARWREPFDSMMDKVHGFGKDIKLAPTDTYISILRKDKKFAVVAVTADRLDIGIKRKGVPAQGRFEESGKWNAMVTHRVRISDPQQLDDELMAWLHEAYQNA